MLLDHSKRTEWDSSESLFNKQFKPPERVYVVDDMNWTKRKTLLIALSHFHAGFYLLSYKRQTDVYLIYFYTEIFSCSILL